MEYVTHNNRKLFLGYKADKPGTDRVLHWLAYHGHEVDGKKVADTVFGPIVDKKDVMLYPFLMKAFPSWRDGSQGIGDCMSWSCAHNIDVLAAVQAFMLNYPEEVLYQVASEAQYGLMRVNIFGRPDNGGDGAYGGAAADAVIKIGSLHRKSYNYGNKYLDLTTYSGSMAKTLGRSGVPKELEPVCKEHTVKTATLVKDFETAANFIMNGYPISNADGSNYTMEGSRDKDGYGVGRGYSHAMNYIGVRWGPKPALLKSNTGWADTVSGPMWPENFPTQLGGCSWWEPAEYVDRVLAGQDSFAYAQYTGFKKQKLPDYGTAIYL